MVAIEVMVFGAGVGGAVGAAVGGWLGGVIGAVVGATMAHDIFTRRDRR